MLGTANGLIAAAPLPWHRRLSARLSAGVVVILVAALVLAGVWIESLDQERFETQHREHAAQVSRMVTRALSDRMLAGGGAAVWQDVTALSLELQQAIGARRILVLARDGRVKATTDTALAGHRFSREKDPECVDCHGAGMRPFPSAVIREDAGRVLRVVGAIEKRPACGACHKETELFRGMIAIDFDLAGLSAAARERQRLLATVGAAATIGTLALLLLLVRGLVHRPLGDVARSARALGAGEFGTRIAVRRDDEVGRLAAEFNRMAGLIQDQVTRIESSRREMELLYNLVVEVSQSLEVEQVRGAVLKVLRERMDFRRLMFCVEFADGVWSTELADAAGNHQVFSGQGLLAEIVAGDDKAIGACLPGVPVDLVREAGRERRSIQGHAGGEHVLVLPFEHRGRLTGVVVATQPRAATAPDGALLENLTAHISLALDNAFHFTRSITDSLTGLANKRHGTARLDEALYVARRHGVPVSLLMIDIDYFKKVNDTHGHLAGDAVLREVARRLRNDCRTGDIVARYGGEEFMVILPHTAAPVLEELGERLRRSIESEPFTLPGGRAIAVTASVGAALGEPRHDRPDTLISRADLALYSAKREGRNRVVVASPVTAS